MALGPLVEAEAVSGLSVHDTQGVAGLGHGIGALAIETEIGPVIQENGLRSRQPKELVPADLLSGTVARRYRPCFARFLFDRPSAR